MTSASMLAQGRGRTARRHDGLVQIDARIGKDGAQLCRAQKVAAARCAPPIQPQDTHTRRQPWYVVLVSVRATYRPSGVRTASVGSDREPGMCPLGIGRGSGAVPSNLMRV